MQHPIEVPAIRAPRTGVDDVALEDGAVLFVPNPPTAVRAPWSPARRRAAGRASTPARRSRGCSTACVRSGRGGPPRAARSSPPPRRRGIRSAARTSTPSTGSSPACRRTGSAAHAAPAARAAATNWSRGSPCRSCCCPAGSPSRARFQVDAARAAPAIEVGDDRELHPARIGIALLQRRARHRVVVAGIAAVVLEQVEPRCMRRTAAVLAK